MYFRSNQFITVGWGVDYYSTEGVGELEPLVRDCHYQAAVGTAERLTSAIKQARIGSHGTEWNDALTFISEKAQV